MSVKKSFSIRLIHDGVQPGPAVAEVTFGLQDRENQVHCGKRLKRGLIQFDVSLDAADDRSRGLVFSGAFAHGPPDKRFLYLSWKRHEATGAPWAWRIKIPLAGIDRSLVDRSQRSGCPIEANVVGRRPHTSEPVTWQVAK